MFENSITLNKFKQEKFAICRKERFSLCKKDKFKIDCFKKNNRLENETDFLDDFCDFNYLNGAELYTFDQFVSHEVDLFWTLLGDGCRPRVIGQESSVFFLKRIVEEKRIHDGMFLHFNTTDTMIARRLYSIMLKSAKSAIPVDEIYSRIIRFKYKKGKDIYSEIKSAIDSYKSLLLESDVIDFPMVYDCFYGLMKSDRYIDELKNIDFIEVRYVGDFIFSRKKFEEYDAINFGKDNVSENDISNMSEFIKKKCSINIFNDDFNTYFEMYTALEKFLMTGSGNFVSADSCNKSSNKVAVVVPSISKDLLEFTHYLNNKGIKSKVFRDSSLYGLNEVLVSAISAYKLLINVQDESILSGLDILLSDEKNIDSFVSMVMFFYKSSLYDFKDYQVGGSLNYFSVRKNIFDIMRVIVKEDVIPCSDKLENVSEFLKGFYMRCGDYITEENSRSIGRICDIIDEITFIEGSKSIFDFILSSTSGVSTSRRLIEDVFFEDVLFIRFDDYLKLPYRFDDVVVFDYFSKKYDFNVESFVDTTLAYMSDVDLEGIDMSSGEVDQKSLEIFISSHENKLEDERFARFLRRIIDDEVKNLILLGSYTSIGGYDQESRLSKRLDIF